MSNVDWISIKNEYLNTSISYRALAKKHGVSLNTLTKRAVREKWAAEREKQGSKITAKVQQKTAENIATREVDRVARLLSLADRLADKLEQAIEQADEYTLKDSTRMTATTYNEDKQPAMSIVTEKVKLKRERGGIDKGGLKKLTSALKDIRDVQGMENDDSQFKKLDEILNGFGGKL